jgi:hypothetical protein
MAIIIGRKHDGELTMEMLTRKKKCIKLEINVFLHVVTAQKMYSIKHGRFIQLEAQYPKTLGI